MPVTLASPSFGVSSLRHTAALGRSEISVVTRVSQLVVPSRCTLTLILRIEYESWPLTATEKSTSSPSMPCISTQCGLVSEDDCQYVDPFLSKSLGNSD